MNSPRKTSAILVIAVCALTLSACDQDKYEERVISETQEQVQKTEEQQQDFSEFEDEGFSVESR